METGTVAAGLLGALLLIVAEFTTLYSVNVAGRYVTTIDTVSAGAHNAYALIPIGLLAVALSWATRATGGRPAPIALAALGLVAVLIAVIGDLPDAHAHGLTAHYQLASNSPGVGFYLETLGGVLLLLAGGLGLTTSAPGATSAPSPSPGERTRTSRPPR